MWGYRVIIPQKFRKSILDELHSAHMGIVKMKSLARSYVWWPSIDKQIEQISQNCSTCAKLASNPPKSSLVTWEWPKEVWTRIHADFFGPCLGRYFFVVEDATSKWLECFEVNNITTNLTIKILRSLFARYGLPKELCTDNGPAFTSIDFQNFLSNSGIKHLTGAPYNPETNGQAESGVKILKKAILKGRSDGITDINLIVNQFLFQYRNTPHTTTGEKPSKLLIGRSLRSKFDLLLPSTENVVSEKQKSQQKYYKGKKDINFNVNDTVWVRDYRSNTPNWCEGKIIKVIGRRTYIVSVEGDLNWKRHVNQLRSNNKVKNPVPIMSQPSIVNICKQNVSQINPMSNRVVSESESSSETVLPSTSDNNNDNITVESNSDRNLRRRSKIMPPDRYQST